MTYLGQEFQYAEDQAIDTTTGTTPIQKLRLSATVLGGVYQVRWAGTVGHTHTSYDPEIQLELDDTTVLGNWGTSGNAQPRNISSAGEVSEFFFGMAIVTLADGAHTFDMDYNLDNSNASDSMAIGHATITLMRVK